MTPAVRIAAWGTLTLAGTLACSEPTAPAPDPFEVAVRVVTLDPAQTFVFPDGPVLACGVDFGAVATGDGIARWEGATFYWYAGTDRSAPIDSVRVSGSTVRASFSRDSISSAQEEIAGWNFSGRAPFELESRFRFLVKGESALRSASVRFTCGPGLPPGGATAPVLTVDAISADGDVEVGDTISVTFTATSAFGLWVAGAEILQNFPYHLGFAEGLNPTATHTVEIEVPWHATIGAPIDLQLYATDGILQRTLVDVGQGIRVVDVTPPVIAGTGPIASSLAIGQQFHIRVDGVDNSQLTWLVYEFAGSLVLRDSVAAPSQGPLTTWNIPLVVQPGWVGSATLHIYLRDVAGLVSGTVELPAGGLTFVPAATP